MVPETSPPPRKRAGAVAAILIVGIGAGFGAGYYEARLIDLHHPVSEGPFRRPLGLTVTTIVDGTAIGISLLVLCAVVGGRRRPSTRKTVALGLLALLAPGSLVLSAKHRMEHLPAFLAPGARTLGSDRPSVLLVTIDTLRQDHVSAYGSSPVKTPVLDGLASEGTLFEQAYCQAPLTTPSHASLLTGLLPPRHGSRYNGIPAKATASGLAPLLKAAGYDTAAFVSVAILGRAMSGLGAGFDTYDELLLPDPLSQQIYLSTPARLAMRLGKKMSPERRARVTVERAVAYLAQRPPNAPPLFLWVHLYDPHVPYKAPEPFRSQSDPAYRGDFEVDRDSVVALRQGKRKLSDRDIEHGRRMYQAEVSYVDASLGPLFSAVKKADRPYLVVATADHGESLGENDYWFFHGENLHAVSMHVPLIMVGPGIPKAVHIGSLVRLVDVMPTLLDLAKVQVPDGLDGHSLALALEGKETLAQSSYGEDGDRLYLAPASGRISLEHKDVGIRTATHSYVLRPSSGAEQLYDLKADPGETTNVAAEPAEAETKARLREELGKLTNLASYGGAVALDDQESKKALEQLGYIGGGGFHEPGF